MTTTRREVVPIRTEEDVVTVRARVTAAAKEVGLSLLDQTKVVTAASELARNALDYGGGGEAVLEVVREPTRQGVRVTFVDDGPGMADVDLALTDRFTTGGGMGLGLGGARRLTDEFHLRSAPGEGTTVTVAKWRRA